MPTPATSAQLVPYSAQVIEYARYIGMDPRADHQLLWIAQQGLNAPLPDGWREHVTE